MASPFIAVALLPLYTDVKWLDVGIVFGIVLIVGGVVTLGAWLWGVME